MIFDSDVIIWATRGHRKAGLIIDQTEDLAISVVTYMEIMRGVRDKTEFHKTKKSLANMKFDILPLSEEIGLRAAVYIEQFGLKSNLGVSDALIAATAAEFNIPLCAANTKDFKLIPDVDLKPFRP